jgi:hypothetical protein
MALPSIIKRGNPLYTFEYLVSGESNDSNQPLSNVTTIVSANLANFGANVYVLNDVASSNAKLNEVDPINHTSITIAAGYNAPTDMSSFAITTTSYNAGSNITVSQTDIWILIADYCNQQIKVVPRLITTNVGADPYLLRDSNDFNTYISTNILGIGPGSSSTQRKLLYIGQEDGYLSNTTLRFGSSNALKTDGYTQINTNAPILRIINSPTTNYFYFIAGSSPYTIRYGGLTGSSFTQLTNLPSWNELLDITFDPLGNLWFTSYTTDLAGASTYTLKKYVFTNESNGSVTYTKTLGSVGSGGTPVVDYIPTKGIVIADDKGNGYFGGCNSNGIQSVYITNPYYTY